MSVPGKIKEVYKQFRCLFSSDYKSVYYTEKYKSLIGICHSSVIFKGKINITDPRNLVIGKNVIIGKKTKFYSEGGIYLEDGVVIAENVSIHSYPKNIEFSSLKSSELGNLHSVMIGKRIPVVKNTSVDASIASENIIKDESVRMPDFFVVSTGRSGTKALAKHLSKGTDIYCRHEAKFIFNRLSTELVHGFKSESQVLEELISLYQNISIEYPDKKIYGECDLKNSNLIPLLHKVNPTAKFIWLIRRADTFVASAFGRRWFDEYEYTFPEPTKSPDTSDNFELFDVYRMEYARYRVNGFLANFFTKVEWEEMSCFERCCWYWNWWNLKIENDLKNLPAQLHFQVKLEEMEDRQLDLFEFLDSDNDSFQFKKENSAYHETVQKETWTEAQKISYEKWCGQLMKKWYDV